MIDKTTIVRIGRRRYDMAIAFDLETTGFNPSRDKIAEVAAIRFDDTGRDEIRYETLIRMSPRFVFPPRVSAINGITTDLTREEGIHAEQAGIRLRELMDPEYIAEESAKVRSGILYVGHGIRKFDIPFLRRFHRDFRSFGIPITELDVWDTLEIERALSTGKSFVNWRSAMAFGRKMSPSKAAYSCKLTDVAERYGILPPENGKPHRAGYDTELAYQIFSKQRTKWITSILKLAP